MYTTDPFTLSELLTMRVAMMKEIEYCDKIVNKNYSPALTKIKEKDKKEAQEILSKLEKATRYEKINY